MLYASDVIQRLKRTFNRLATFERLFTNVFQHTELGSLLRKHPVTCIDVGSRGGFEKDLLPIAFAVRGIGFEPDPDAFMKLQGRAPAPWSAMQHLQVALARSAGNRVLHVPSHAGSSSLLEHDSSFGQRFHCPQYFDVQRTVSVRTEALDDVFPTNVGSPSFIKLDVEGLELEVLQGATKVVDEVVAAKVEVSFLPFRKQQPLASDIERFFRERGFEVIDLRRPGRWRIYQSQHSYVPEVEIPFSRGQLVQGDFLLFRPPHLLRDTEKRIAAAAIASAYGFFDHALACLDHPVARDALRLEGIENPGQMIAAASKLYAAAERKARLKELTRELNALVTVAMRG